MEDAFLLVQFGFDVFAHGLLGPEQFATGIVEAFEAVDLLQVVIERKRPKKALVGQSGDDAGNDFPAHGEQLWILFQLAGVVGVAALPGEGIAVVVLDPSVEEAVEAKQVVSRQKGVGLFCPGNFEGDDVVGFACSGALFARTARSEQGEGQ